MRRQKGGVICVKWERGLLRQNWHKRRARNKKIIKLNIIDNDGKSHTQINKSLLQCETTSSNLQQPFRYAMNNQQLFMWTTVFIMNNQSLRKTILWSLCMNLLLDTWCPWYHRIQLSCLTHPPRNIFNKQTGPILNHRENVHYQE